MSTPSKSTWPDGRPVEPDDGPPGRRLAAAALADQPERLAPLDRRSETPSTAWTTSLRPPNRLVERLIGKWTLRSRTSTTGGRRAGPDSRLVCRSQQRGRRATGRRSRPGPGASRPPDAPRPRASSSGVSSDASLADERAARRERAPRRRRIRSGGWPGMLWNTPAVTRSTRGTQRSRPTVYGWRGSANSSSRGATSTIRPPYIDGDAVADARPRCRGCG